MFVCLSSKPYNLPKTCAVIEGPFYPNHIHANFTFFLKVASTFKYRKFKPRGSVVTLIWER